MVREKIRKFQKAADEVASFFKSRLDKNIRIKINTHTDPDGIAAGNIIARCFKHYDVPFHISFKEPPEPEDLRELGKQDYDLFVFLDQGAGQFPSIEEHILETDHEVLILDHHPGEVRKQAGLAYLNPHTFDLNGAKDVSSAGVAYSVAKRLDEKFKPLSEMAIIGALGDRQESPSGFTGINRNIVEEAVENEILKTRKGLKLENCESLVECLNRSIRPFLTGLSGNKDAALEFIEDIGLDPDTSLEELEFEKEKELRDGILERIRVEVSEGLRHSLWGNIYTSQVEQTVGPKKIHEYVTMLDACEKSGKIGVGFSVLFGDKNSEGEAFETLQKYQEHMIDVISWLASRKEKIKITPQMRYIYVGDKLETKIIGEALSIAIESGIIEGDRPVLCLADQGEDRLKVSARASSEYTQPGVDIGEVLRKVSKSLGGNGGGHDVAAAARLPRERKDEFIKKVDQLLESIN